MQSKRHSTIESLTNVIVGLLVSFVIQLTLFPALGMHVSTNKHLLITFVFFVASFVRGYVIRRMFNRIK